ncbi:MAG: HlyD family type I secretion periplasmic adaptor subunit [Hyphomicrobiales bacterium]|nr:HlyD family type I secretion periplasmic adaptor subunit [Hyphomicrobiales bacterium]
MSERIEALQRSLRRQVLAIGATAGVVVIGIGGWAATTELSGAVIASGQVVVNSNVKKVQHPSGGIVGELRVRDGQRVKAGEVLLRFDDTQTRASLAILTKTLDELAARQAREEAERDGAYSVAIPKELADRMDDADVSKAVNGELWQFATRRSAREGQRAQLRERIAQLSDEVRGLEAQIVSKNNQVDWINKELVGVNNLWQKKLIPYTRVSSLERDKERLDGERGQLIAATAQAKGKVVEIELQIQQIDQDMRSEVGKDLADIRTKMAELGEKRIAAEDVLRRLEIRAPLDGLVHQQTVHTLGGVVGPAEVMMLIVPGEDALEIEARIQPQDIDQIRVGQQVLLRFSAFNQRTTPELNGEVARISADVSEDQKTGVRYYTVRVTVPQHEINRLGELKLVPGMPVESFVQSGPRTVMSYLIRPLHDQITRAFREK